MEIVKPLEKRRMPDKLEFDYQRCKTDKRRTLEKIQKSQETNKVNLVRWKSMELLKPDLSGDPHLLAASD